MPGRRKKFPCGHSGHGLFCHRCREDEQKRRLDNEDRARREEKKQAWQERLASAPVDLSDLPRHVAEKALDIIEELRKPRLQQRLAGRRFTNIGRRDILRFEIGWSYRLICREAGGELEFLEVISHETYNSRLASGGWS